MRFNYTPPQTSNDVLKQNLWFNSEIRLKDTPYISYELYNANIKKVKDIYSIEEERFLTYPETVNAHDYQGSYLEYYTVVTSVLRSWKERLKEYPRGGVIPDGISRIKDVTKPSRLISDWLLEVTFSPKKSVARELWFHDLQIDIDEATWARLYPEVMTYTKSTRLRYFQYRLLNKRLVTNVHRAKWDKQVTDTQMYM